MVTTKRADELITIIVLGAPAVGKKNFIRRYCTDFFSDLYDPLTEISSERRVANIASKTIGITLERVPTPFLSSPSEAARIATAADAVILMYDASHQAGLEDLARLSKDVDGAKLLEGRPVAVVAGKADAAGERWEEAMEGGRKLAEEYGAAFCVTSALWGDGVKDTVEELVKRVLKQRGVLQGEGVLPRQ